MRALFDWRVWGGLVLGCVVSCGGGGKQSVDYDGAAADASHAAMVERLAEIERRGSADNRFSGDGQLRFLKQRLAGLGPDAPAEQRFGLTVDIARIELRLGEVQRSIEQFEAAALLVPQLAPAARPAADALLHWELAVAQLRRGENDNCVHCTHGLGCLFPIEPGGVHDEPAGSLAAKAHLEALLDHPAADEPTRLRARWLLTVAAMTLGKYPDGVDPRHRIPPEAFASDEEFPRFPQVAADKGIDTLSSSGAAAAEDFDGDGDFDLLSSGFELQSTLRYFAGDGRGNFADQTSASGLAGYPGGLNMITGDVDNDGDVDVYVLRGAWLAEVGRQPNSLLANDGSGRFRDVTILARLDGEAFPTQTAALSDYDNDGDLDLYVGNEDYASQLYQNQGDGTFVDVAAAAGVENRRYAKAVQFADVDGDTWPDLYVSNYKGKNRLYKNLGDGTFTDIAEAAGVELPLLSFPAWFFDADNDGHLDLFVSSYVEEVAETAASYLGLPRQGEPSRLYKGDGAFGFVDRHKEAGLTDNVAAMGANFGDLDNDGWLDMYLGSGWPAYEALVPNVMYRNREGKFLDVSAAGGFGHLQKGHAVVFADFDRDGDQDVFEQMGGAFKGDAFHDAYFENPGFGANWIAVRVEGVRSNRSGVGARIAAHFEDGGAPRTLVRFVGGGGSFGANPLELHIGLGSAERIARLEVFWPTSGTTDVLLDVEPNQVLRVREGAHPR